MADGPLRRPGAARPPRIPPRPLTPARVVPRAPPGGFTGPNPSRGRSQTLLGVAPPAAPVGGRVSMPSLAIDAEPTVLVVGDGFAAIAELEQALSGHGLYCETASADVAAYTAVAVAPDLVLLVGDTASEGQEEVTRLLRGALGERMPPVAVVLQSGDLASRLEAFRRGAVAVLGQADDAAKLGQEIANLIRELAQRGGAAGAPIGEASLDELLAALSKELRAELIDERELESGPVRLVLGGGKPLALALREFVTRIKRHVVSATPLPLDPARLREQSSPESVREDLLRQSVAREPGDMSGVRILVADDDAGRADAVAQALRAHGAEVMVSSLAPTTAHLKRLRSLDPIVLLTGDDHIPGLGLPLLRDVRDDYRLRWASLCVLRWAEVWPDPSGPPSIEPMLGTLAALSELEHAAEQRAAARLSFDLRLESIGPIRLLRAVCACPTPTRIKIDNPRIDVEVELCAGLVERVIARPKAEGVELGGLDALSALSVLHAGKVSVEPGEPLRPESLGRLEDLLAELDGRAPPVAPSLFPEAVGGVLPPSLGAPPIPKDIPGAEPLAEAPLASAPVVSTAEPAAVRDRAPARPPDSWRMRLLGARSMPFWIVIVALSSIVVALLVSVLGSRPDERLATGEKDDEAPSPATESSEPAPAAASSLLDRARRGDPAALAELEAISADKRSPDQAFALASGQLARQKNELAALIGELKADPSRLSDRTIRRKLMAAARDPVTGAETLRGLSTIDSPDSVDLIYDVWTGTRQKTPLTELAESLVFSRAVRQRASPALAVALDLRTAADCNAAAEAVERANTHGDRRALTPLSRLVARRGCGPKKTADCYPCLRGDSRLRDALAAVRKRKSP